MTQQVFDAGIDVGRQHLDVAVFSTRDQCLRVDHDADGLARLIEWLRVQGVARVGVETSGGYEREVVDRLQAAGFVGVSLNLRRVRRFA